MIENFWEEIDAMVKRNLYTEPERRGKKAIFNRKDPTHSEKWIYLEDSSNKLQDFYPGAFVYEVIYMEMGTKYHQKINVIYPHNGEIRIMITFSLGKEKITIQRPVYLNKKHIFEGYPKDHEVSEVKQKLLNQILEQKKYRLLHLTGELQIEND